VAVSYLPEAMTGINPLQQQCVCSWSRGHLGGQLGVGGVSMNKNVYGSYPDLAFYQLSLQTCGIKRALKASAVVQKIM